ncbi:hypothetical protein GLUCOINTEAF2_0204063 [Komagataeibacter intermedius AF2]|uniref:Uncharacterized protein n=1 Tax=Komagataeibacter intermedius AF2 TaxID=1458464 RepID=A0A0N1N479_9PROT|nr:hypothetical protein GLUCOINTEAF2_0204063 [Komagataeibacter intermedius AF2]
MDDATGIHRYGLALDERLKVCPGNTGDFPDFGTPSFPVTSRGVAFKMRGLTDLDPIGLLFDPLARAHGILQAHGVGKVGVAEQGKGFVADACRETRKILKPQPEHAVQAASHGQLPVHAVRDVGGEFIVEKMERRVAAACLELEDLLGGAVEAGAKKLGHDAATGRDHDLAQSGQRIRGILQRGQRDDENAAVQHHIAHIDVGRLGAEDMPETDAKLREDPGEIHLGVAMLLARFVFFLFIPRQRGIIPRQFTQIGLGRIEDIVGNFGNADLNGVIGAGIADQEYAMPGQRADPA